MESCEAGAIMYNDVIKKFNDLKHQYYTNKGCMISTVDSKFSKLFLENHTNLKWKKKYNKYAESEVYTAEIHVFIFGKPFVVYLHRPIKQIHRWEYEYFFGFGGHNEGFSYDRIIATFQETFDKKIDIEYLLMTGTLTNSCKTDSQCEDDSNGECCVINEEYIKNVLKLLVIGGYVKQWNAFNNFKKWFKDHGYDITSNIDDDQTTTSFIFENYKLIEEDNADNADNEGDTNQKDEKNDSDNSGDNSEDNS